LATSLPTKFKECALQELSVQPVEIRWHGTVSDVIIMLNGTSVLPHVGGSGLHGLTCYRGIAIEITQEISVPRFSWVLCKGMAVYRGALYQGLTAINYEYGGFGVYINPFL
jgi:hypothetical protein